MGREQAGPICGGQSKGSSQGTPRHASEITEDKTAMEQKDQKRGDMMDDNGLDEDEASASQLHDYLNFTCTRSLPNHSPQSACPTFL